MASRHLTAEAGRSGRSTWPFPHGGLTPAERKLRSDLVTAVAVSAVIAAAVALVVAVFVAKGLVRPIRRLSEAAHALGSGTTSIRVGEQNGPGELVELAGAFDSMAASLERHEQLRQEMVADVAHELRTPVAILQAETEALVDGVSVPTPEALVSLHDESLRLGRMVQDLQTLASADAAGLSLERSEVDLAAVAARAADSLEGRFSSPGSGWSATCPPPPCGLTPAGYGRSWPTSWLTQPSSPRREAPSAWSSIATCAAPASRWPTPARAYPGRTRAGLRTVLPRQPGPQGGR